MPLKIKQVKISGRGEFEPMLVSTPEVIEDGVTSNFAPTAD